MSTYILSETPATRNEAFETLQDVTNQGTFTKEEAVEILCKVLSWDERQASQAFDGLIASNSLIEV